MSGAGHPSRPARGTQGRVGFEAASDVYERGRPGYQDDLVSFVVDRAGIGPGIRVLDLAAGTGKFTRQLLPFGAACIAVEPSASMREVLTEVVPGVPVVAGVGEAIPLVAESLQAVVVAQAFHWFDAPRALAEIARVLRPGGVLSLVWNERDEKDPVMIELSRMTWWDRCMPYPVGMDFSPIIDASHRFGPVTRSEFQFTQPLDRQALVDQVASRSYVRVLPDDQRAAFLGDVAAFAGTLDEPIMMPYNTQLFTATVAK
ncbi:MAG TPA: methyltransferase domain-containing protein [Acidimicrobiales bacterium]|jgi:SAM-dependent methyltransferase|nr:methyltransferase domain-containing protein [Acidimicrobiales bacterium]